MTGIVFTGFWYAVGKTLSAFICGLDCGDYVVAGDGTISVPYQSDAGQLLTPAFVKAQHDIGVDPANSPWPFASYVTVTIGGLPTICHVPVVIGFTYTSDAQLLRPNHEKDAKTQQGPAFGETRRIHRFAALLDSSQAVSFGTEFNKMHPARFVTDGGTATANNVLFSGTYVDTIEADHDFDNMVCWRVTRPLPCTVVAITGNMHTQEV